MKRLGDLERAIMDVLWEIDEGLTVRQVSGRLADRELAHTTVMTVLDRLAKKGFARRARDGRAFRYMPATSREAFVAELMLSALAQTGDRSAALARFARSVSEDEAQVLRRALAAPGSGSAGPEGRPPAALRPGPTGLEGRPPATPHPGSAGAGVRPRGTVRQRSESC